MDLETELIEAARKVDRNVATKMGICKIFRPILQNRDSAYETLAATNVTQGEALAEHERLARQFVDHVNGLKKQIADLTAGNEGYAGAVTSLQDDRDRLRTTITKQTAQLTTLENANEKWSQHHDRESNHETIDELKRQLEKARRQTRTQANTIEEVDARAAEAEDNHADAAGQVDDLEGQVANMENQIEALQGDVRHLQDQLAEADA